jgi:hypothetical protein
MERSDAISLAVLSQASAITPDVEDFPVQAGVPLVAFHRIGLYAELTSRING